MPDVKHQAQVFLSPKSSEATQVLPTNPPKVSEAFSVPRGISLRAVNEYATFPVVFCSWEHLEAKGYGFGHVEYFLDEAW